MSKFIKCAILWTDWLVRSDAGVELFGRGHIQPAGIGGLGKVCRPYRQGDAGVMSDLLLSGPAVGRTSVPAFLPFPAAIR